MQLAGFRRSKTTTLAAIESVIVGAGGLGCPAAQYLAATGVGTITIADFDIISKSAIFTGRFCIHRMK